jgi:eukaryotic-like serine/threonine-protein kinase
VTPLGDLAAAWPRLNDLLDEALALPPPERAGWLAALPAEHAALKDTLAKLLDVRSGIETGDFLGTLPKLDGASAATLTPDIGAPKAGDAVGPYRLLRELGEGGMGSVWLAERSDGQLKRQVALKLPRLTWARGLAERLARERDILATLEHPHIARLYDAGVDKLGRPWLALEYVQGRPIDSVAKNKGLTVRQRVELLLQVCDAVAYAHSRLVIHRDLKPGNILVTDDGQVRLLDFGIAKLIRGDRAEGTALTALAGRALTLDYASPEQVRGQALTTASDVYSLGVVAYEVLAGTRPYRLKRGSAAELEEAIQNADPPAASAAAGDAATKTALRGDLDAILQRTLHKAAGERYPTIAALGDDLRRHLAGEPIAARPHGVARRLQRFVLRHRWPVGAAAVSLGAFGTAIGVGATALVLLALLLGLGLALWQARVARRQALQARREAARARAVQDFLIELFVHNDGRVMDRAAAQATTARDLLDRGSARLDTALKDDPEARYQILYTLGNIYWNIEAWEQVVDVEARRVRLAREMFGPRDPRLAEVLINHAESLRHSQERGRVPAILQEADEVLARTGQQRSENRAGMVGAALQYWVNESLPQALRTADEGLAFMSEHQPGSNRRVIVYMFSAPLRLHLGLFDLAVDHAMKSLEVVRTLTDEDQRSWSRVPTQFICDTLVAAMRLAEAEPWLRRLVALTRELQGEQSGAMLTAKAKLGNALMEAGPLDEGRALLDEVHATLAETPAWLGTSDAASVRANAGMRWLERGRPDLLLSALRDELALLADTRPLSPRRAQLLLLAARSHAAMDDAAAAAATLEQAEDVWRRYADGLRAAAMDDEFRLARAALQLAAGRPEPALDALHDAEAIGPRLSISIAAARAAGLLELRRLDEARVALAAAQAAAAKASPAGLSRVLAAEIAMLDGRLRLAANEPNGAADALRHALKLRIGHDDAASLWVARIQESLAAALAAQGPTAAAEDAAAEARRTRASIVEAWATDPASRGR